MKILAVFICSISLLCGCANVKQPASSGSSAQAQAQSENDRKPWIGDHTHPDNIYFGD